MYMYVHFIPNVHDEEQLQLDCVSLEDISNHSSKLSIIVFPIYIPNVGISN